MKFSTNSNQKHLVNLTIPSCSCADWRKTQYPCKHFFAVFNTFEEWDFNSLPAHYRNSVFITLDTGHLEINYPAVNSTTKAAAIPDTQDVTADFTLDESQDDSTGSSCDFEMETEKPSPTDKLNKTFKAADHDRPSRSANLRSILQAELNAVKDSSFLVEDDDTLAKAIEEIKRVHEVMLKSCPKRNGLPLRSSPVKKKLKPNRIEFHQVFHKKLPKRRKWKKKISVPKVVIGEQEEIDVKEKVQYSCFQLITCDVADDFNSSCELLCTFHNLISRSHLIFIRSKPTVDIRRKI